MLLSIGMIVKNEEEYLDNCLTALEPLLNNLDCELIIADTGSTDNTLQIAKKYTKNVYSYKWNNDFAAARNFTLEKSKGEWFMYIDADEILIKCEQLINFLNSDESSNYNSIKYKLNNLYKNTDGNTIVFPSRIFRRDTDTKFEGIIHENIRLKEPIIILKNTLFDHYGYLNDNFEKTQNKIYRNLNLLLKDFNNENNTIRHSIHICDCYIELNDYTRALQYLYKGLDKAIITNNHNYICIIYSYICKIYFTIENYDKVIYAVNNYLNIKDKERTTDIDIYYMLSLANYYKSNYKLYINYFNIYNNLIQKYNDETMCTQDYFIKAIRCNSKYNEQTLNSYLCITYLKLNKTSKATTIINNQLIVSDDYNLKAKLQALVYYYIKTDNYIDLILLLNNEKYNKIVYSEIENYLETYIVDIKFFISNIVNILISSTQNYTFHDNLYTNILKLRYYYFNNRDDKVIELMNNILVAENIELNKDLLFFIIRYNIDIYNYISTIDIDNIKLLLKDCEKIYGSVYSYIENYNYYNNSIDEIYFNINIIEYGLENICMLDKNKVIQIFLKFTEYNTIYFENVYNKIIWNENNINFIPKNMQFRYYCTKAMNQYNIKNNIDCIKNLKSALLINKNFQNVISIVSNKILKELEKPKTEFEILAKNIKNNIIQLIETNDLENAKKLLNEYKQIYPNDKDIININKLISI